MKTYEAPAKLNLSLHVSPPRKDGYHPLESLVQTIEWCDLLEVEDGEGHDELDSDIEDNLIERALAGLRSAHDVPPLRLNLEKSIPVGAGLGGGSSDAAAALVAGAEAGRIARGELPAIAASVGSDVPLFLTGGTLMMRGVGEVIESLQPVDDFAVAVVLPDFGLSTPDVYRRWDQLEGPVADAVPDRSLPPSLRGGMPMRNDLLPSARNVEPLLGDFMADIATVWGVPVCLTGSGSACFGYFATPDEASDAAAAVSGLVRDGRGVAPRRQGIRLLEDRAD